MRPLRGWGVLFAAALRRPARGVLPSSSVSVALAAAPPSTAGPLDVPCLAPAASAAGVAAASCLALIGVGDAAGDSIGSGEARPLAVGLARAAEPAAGMPAAASARAAASAAAWSFRCSAADAATLAALARVYDCHDALPQVNSHQPAAAGTSTPRALVNCCAVSHSTRPAPALLPNAKAAVRTTKPPRVRIVVESQWCGAAGASGVGCSSSTAHAGRSAGTQHTWQSG
jgi:hypothetical protein